nr:hypothetical protein [Nocardia sp. CS682]
MASTERCGQLGEARRRLRLVGCDDCSFIRLLGVAPGECGREIPEFGERTLRRQRAYFAQPRFEQLRRRFGQDEELAVLLAVGESPTEFSIYRYRRLTAFDDNVCVDAAETEGGHTGPARRDHAASRPGGFVGGALGVRARPGHRRAGQVEQRVCGQQRMWPLVSGDRRNGCVMHGKDRLDQSRDACCCLGVPDVRLHRADADALTTPVPPGHSATEDL